MHIGMLKNSMDARVLITPETTKKLIDIGHKIYVEHGSGDASGFQTAEYEAAGASIHKDMPTDAIQTWLTLAPPRRTLLLCLQEGTTVLGILQPSAHSTKLLKWAKTGSRFLALDLIPRTARTRSMDVLASQSNLAGYRAVMMAAERYGRSFHLMMTAAGTVQAARVLVLGSGIAGLQAMATAKRLGALVKAFDVRSTAQEEVESLGVHFIKVEREAHCEEDGEYTNDITSKNWVAQSQALTQALQTTDIVITTVLVPGSSAPTLITKAMLDTAAMRPGSIIVDLAGEAGGNCEVSRYGKEVTYNGTLVMSPSYILNAIAQDASQLLACNVMHFLRAAIDQNGQWVEDDEIVKSTQLIHNHQVVHPLFTTKAHMGDER